MNLALAVQDNNFGLIGAVVIFVLILGSIAYFVLASEYLKRCAECGKLPANNTCGAYGCHKKLCDSCVVRTTDQPDHCMEHSALSPTNEECEHCHESGGMKGTCSYCPKRICSKCSKFDNNGMVICNEHAPVLSISPFI